MTATTATPRPMFLTDKGFSVMINGRLHTLSTDHPNYDEGLRLATDPTVPDEQLLFIFDLQAAMDHAVEQSQRLTLTEGGSLLFDGQPLETSFSAFLTDVAVNAPEQLPAYEAFVHRAYANPDPSVREDMLNWVINAQMPVTPDGYILAFKYVRGDYLDVHSGTMDNSPGTIVSMPREHCDRNRNRYCSTGLHFASRSFVRSNVSYSDNYNPTYQKRVVMVKVDPADVTSFPTDGYDKGRTCRYEVVSDVTEEFFPKEENPIPFEDHYVADYEDDTTDTTPLRKRVWSFFGRRKGAK